MGRLVLVAPGRDGSQLDPPHFSESKINMKTIRLTRGRQLATFRVIGRDSIRFTRIDGVKLMELKVLTKAEARVRLAEMKAAGFKIVR